MFGLSSFHGLTDTGPAGGIGLEEGFPQCPEGDPIPLRDPPAIEAVGLVEDAGGAASVIGRFPVRQAGPDPSPLFHGTLLQALIAVL